MNKNGINYLDETVFEYFCTNPRTLYRYMDYTTMKDRELWFSNPSTKWSDPYEKLFLDSKYLLSGNKEDKYPLKNRVFCSCLTPVRVSEAAWKVYGYATKFSIDTTRLVQVLEEHTRDYDIYIGKVNYKSASSLKRDSVLKLTGLSKESFISSDEAWVRLLLLKRTAFKYEEEIRIILVPKKEQNSEDGVTLDYDISLKDLFFHVELAPPLLDLSSDYNPEAVRDRLTSEFKFSSEQITNCNLYEDARPRCLRVY